jgi:hypothetical protein
MKIKTSDLIGAALDWAVAKCEGFNQNGECLFIYQNPDVGGGFNPSTDWAQGGPIVEREKIQTWFDCGDWCAAMPNEEAMDRAGGANWDNGPTPLIAAMRCLVASKLGEEVDIPEELK